MGTESMNYEQELRTPTVKVEPPLPSEPSWEFWSDDSWCDARMAASALPALPQADKDALFWEAEGEAFSRLVTVERWVCEGMPGRQGLGVEVHLNAVEKVMVDVHEVAREWSISVDGSVEMGPAEAERLSRMLMEAAARMGTYFAADLDAVNGARVA